MSGDTPLVPCLKVPILCTLTKKPKIDFPNSHLQTTKTLTVPYKKSVSKTKDSYLRHSYIFSGVFFEVTREQPRGTL